jgi:hypothetical protein
MQYLRHSHDLSASETLPSESKRIKIITFKSAVMSLNMYYFIQRKGLDVA